MAEKEKLNGGVSNGYSPDKSGLALLGIFSLSLQEANFLQEANKKLL